MSRRAWRAVAPILLLAVAIPAFAQEKLEAQSGAPPERIDLLVDRDEIEGPLEDCSDEQQAASISGEIIVCRRKRDQSDELYSGKKEAERRYAAETMNKNDPRAPDVFGITHQGVTAARGCFFGPCPPPPAYIIDVEALPEAPPGSDADRVARGLAPRGEDSVDAQAVAGELGLPSQPGDAPSPSGSASPEGAR